MSGAEVILSVWTLINSEKTLAKGHSSIMCAAVSVPWELTSQVPLEVIFFLNKFSLHWMRLLRRCQVKNCNRCAAWLPQMNLARSSCCCPDFRSLYSSAAEKVPVMVMSGFCLVSCASANWTCCSNSWAVWSSSVACGDNRGTRWRMLPEVLQPVLWCNSLFVWSYLTYKPWLISQRTIFFSHTKPANGTFSHGL